MNSAFKKSNQAVVKCFERVEKKWNYNLLGSLGFLILGFFDWIKGVFWNVQKYEMQKRQVEILGKSLNKK